MPVLIAYRACYVLLLASCRLAAGFRALAEARERLGPLTVILQLPVVLCWPCVRPVSLAAYSGCCALARRL